MAERYINVDLHAHTTYSDAVFSPNDRILQACHKSDLRIVPVTDHETTLGVSDMQREIEDFNRLNQTNLALFSGIEFRTVFTYGDNSTWADIVVGRLGYDEQFLQWAEDIQETTPSSVDVINQAVSDYGALAIIPHPGLTVGNSVPLELLPYLVDQLPDDVRGRVAVEIVNSACNAFPGASDRVSARRLFAGERGMMEVGNSDAHHPWERGAVYTSLPVDGGELSHESLVAGLMQKDKVQIVDKGTRVSHLVTACIMMMASVKNLKVTGRFPVDIAGSFRRKKMIALYNSNRS